MQITFKHPVCDITISGDTVEEIEQAYNEVSKKLGLKPSQARPVAAKAVMETGDKYDKNSIPARILELKADGFFASPRPIGEVQKKLATLGITKPVTSLSAPLQKLVLDRHLRRSEKKGNGRKVWVYQA